MSERRIQQLVRHIRAGEKSHQSIAELCDFAESADMQLLMTGIGGNKLLEKLRRIREVVQSSRYNIHEVVPGYLMKEILEIVDE
jgi:queuine/archaeosine tRNA-ribosyltransferase